MCVYCDEMNATTGPIQVSEIYIGNKGFCKYHVPMAYCPFCGEKVKPKTWSPDFYSVKHAQYGYDKMDVKERNAAALEHL